MKRLLGEIDETVDVAWKEGSGWPKFVPAKEVIKLVVKKWFLAKKINQELALCHQKLHITLKC